MLVTIYGELPTLNEYINAERTNKHIAAKIKKTATDVCAYNFNQIQRNRIEHPAEFLFMWFTRNKRTDPDNIAFAKKFVFDGMVKAGFIQNDGWSQVRRLEDRFTVDKNCPRLVIQITEIK